MSALTIASYFPFRRIKIINQHVLPDTSESRIFAQPDKRFYPICQCCGRKASGIHSWTRRTIRDLNLAEAKVWISCQYRKLFCTNCQRISIEDLNLFHPYLRVTKRLALYIHHLCRFMTVIEVAQHLQLDWKTVKNIDKWFLERQYGQPDLNGLKVLAVDEISVKKGHRYLTVVLDYLSGRVVYVGKHRKSKTLETFFNQLSQQQCDSIEAIVMDMWDPFIKAVKKKYLKLKSSLTCSMWSPNLTASSIKCETANIVRPLKKTRRSLRAPDTCC